MKGLRRIARSAIVLTALGAAPGAMAPAAQPVQADETAPATEAEHLARVAAFEQAGEPDDPDYLDALAGLGLFYVNQGRHADAVPVLRRALAASERMLGADDELTEEIRVTLVLLERFVDGQ